MWMAFPLRLKDTATVPLTVGKERLHSLKICLSGEIENLLQPAWIGTMPNIFAGSTARGPPLQAWFTLPQSQSPSTPTFQPSNKVS